MKKISHILLIAIASLYTMSCTNDEYPEPKNQEISIFDISNIKDLKYYYDFECIKKAQFNNIISFERQKDFYFDQDYFAYLLFKEGLIEEEHIELNNILNHIGFNCIYEFIKYDAVITQFAYELMEKTSFLENEPEEILLELENIFQDFQLYPEKSCLGRFSNCVNSSHATYTLNILFCAGGAISIGAATGGWGGVIFQLACSGGAYWKFSSDLDSCLTSYDAC